MPKKGTTTKYKRRAGVNIGTLKKEGFAYDPPIPEDQFGGDVKALRQFKVEYKPDGTGRVKQWKGIHKNLKTGKLYLADGLRYRELTETEYDYITKEIGESKQLGDMEKRIGKPFRERKKDEEVIEPQQKTPDSGIVEDVIPEPEPKKKKPKKKKEEPATQDYIDNIFERLAEFIEVGEVFFDSAVPAVFFGKNYQVRWTGEIFTEDNQKKVGKLQRRNPDGSYNMVLNNKRYTVGKDEPEPSPSPEPEPKKKKPKVAATISRTEAEINKLLTTPPDYADDEEVLVDEVTVQGKDLFRDKKGYLFTPDGDWVGVYINDELHTNKDQLKFWGVSEDDVNVTKIDDDDEPSFSPTPEDTDEDEEVDPFDKERLDFDEADDYLISRVDGYLVLRFKPQGDDFGSSMTDYKDYEMNENYFELKQNDIPFEYRESDKDWVLRQEGFLNEFGQSALQREEATFTVPSEYYDYSKPEAKYYTDRESDEIYLEEEETGEEFTLIGLRAMRGNRRVLIFGGEQLKREGQSEGEAPKPVLYDWETKEDLGLEEDYVIPEEDLEQPPPEDDWNYFRDSKAYEMVLDRYKTKSIEELELELKEMKQVVPDHPYKTKVEYQRDLQQIITDKYRNSAIEYLTNEILSGEIDDMLKSKILEEIQSSKSKKETTDMGGGKGVRTGVKSKLKVKKRQLSEAQLKALADARERRKKKAAESAEKKTE